MPRTVSEAAASLMRAYAECDRLERVYLRHPTQANQNRYENSRERVRANELRLTELQREATARGDGARV